MNVSTKPDQKIIQKAIQKVEALLQHQLSSDYTFHNLSHTEEVLEVAKSLAKNSNLSAEDKEILLLAACFQYTGYTQAHVDFWKHSQRLASDFLEKAHYDSAKIQQVSQLIQEAHQGQTPDSYLAKLLVDANHAFYGRKRYFRYKELLRTEENHFRSKPWSRPAWEKHQLDQLSHHRFYTPPAREKYEARRTKNINKQKEEIEDTHKLVRRKKTGKDFGRGIDTLYRATYRNHINFSSIADGKANMMISVNAIILSIIITLSGAGITFSQKYMANHLYVFIPITILLLSSLVSAVFAISSARPKITISEIDQQKIRERKVSPLYFGNFLGMSQEVFLEELRTLKNDQQLLYDMMSVDMYALGKVLRKKYRLLSISYDVFMYGLIFSVLGLLISAIYASL